MSLAANLTRVCDQIDQALHASGRRRSVKIVAVTKTHPPERILEAHAAGIRCIGENRVQEAEAKFSRLLPLEGLEKRMVGHLQTNKVNKALSLFDYIDAVDSLRLARKIGRRAEQLGLTIPVLLEVNTSGEATKFGFDPQATEPLLGCLEVNHLRVQGLMTIGPLGGDEIALRGAFRHLRKLQDDLNARRPGDCPELQELSMGMSADFQLAVQEGSTMVRLGTVLFGPRGE